MSVLPQRQAKTNKSHGLELQNFHRSHASDHFKSVFQVFSQDNRNIRKQPTDSTEKGLAPSLPGDCGKIKGQRPAWSNISPSVKFHTEAS